MWFRFPFFSIAPTVSKHVCRGVFWIYTATLWLIFPWNLGQDENNTELTVKNHSINWSFTGSISRPQTRRTFSTFSFLLLRPINTFLGGLRLWLQPQCDACMGSRLWRAARYRITIFGVYPLYTFKLNFSLSESHLPIFFLVFLNSFFSLYCCISNMRIFFSSAYSRCSWRSRFLSF